MLKSAYKLCTYCPCLFISCELLPSEFSQLFFGHTQLSTSSTPPLQGGQSQEQTDFYLSSPFCTFASFTFWRKLSFQFHYFCAHAGSDCSYCFWLSASLLFAVNIYVLFCDIISKYFLILLNPSGGAGEKVKCQKWLAKFWPTFVDESNRVLHKL